MKMKIYLHNQHKIYESKYARTPTLFFSIILRASSVEGGYAWCYHVDSSYGDSEECVLQKWKHLGRKYKLIYNSLLLMVWML